MSSSYEMRPCNTNGAAAAEDNNDRVVHTQQLSETKASDVGVDLANSPTGEPLENEASSEEFDLSNYINQDCFEDLERPNNSRLINSIDFVSQSIRALLQHKKTKWVFLILIIVAYYSYVSVCIWHFINILPTATLDERQQSIRLFWVTALMTILAACNTAYRFCSDKFDKVFNGLVQLLSDLRVKYGDRPKYIWYLIQIAIIVGFVAYVAIALPDNLISFVGMLVLLLIAFASSRDHAMVDYRPVLGGLVLQLLFALLVLKTQWGFAMFEFFGDRVSEFLVHVDAGSSFLFGNDFRQHFFAFSVLSIVIFFFAITSLLFHWGILSYIIEKIGIMMELVMGTSTTESLVAAANIFIGMTEAPMMIAPFLKAMTNAEIHSIMTSGFATIAGSVLAAYVGMGVSAKHLIGASVMSAPAALAVSKLMYPETKKNVIRPEVARRVKMEKFSNFLEAAGVGAMNAIGVVSAIAVNLIAFISILAFLNATLTWFGHRAGLQVDLTFELITSYCLWPLAFVMGVPSRDCFAVAELIGVKTFVNEFVAYGRLSQMQNNYNLLMNFSRNGNLSYTREIGFYSIPDANATVVGSVIFEEKSQVIATYSLCGFSNMGSIGILIGALSALAPTRRTDIANCVVSAMIAGNIACFLTASISGLFFEPTA